MPEAKGKKRRKVSPGILSPRINEAVRRERLFDGPATSDLVYSDASFNSLRFTPFYFHRLN